MMRMKGDPEPAARQAAGFDRGQAVFIAVTLSIVLGGLWFLSGLDGPYHPAGEVSGPPAG